MWARAITMATAAACLAGACGCQAVAQKQAMDHYAHGQLMAGAGNEDGALAELQAAIKEDPNLSAAHAMAGDIYRRRGNYELARQSYENACRTDPYAFRPHYNLAVTYQLLAEAAKAMDQWESNIRDAVRNYLRAITLEPDDFETNLNLSACYFQLGKTDQAEHYCREAIRLNPNSPQAYCNLGTIFDSQNRLEEALEAYKLSLDYDTHQPNLLMNLGSTYMRMSRPNAALNAYQLAAKEDPNCAAAYEQIGQCCFHMRQYPDAVEAYKKSVWLDPSSASAQRGLGVVCMAMYVLDRTKTDLRSRALSAWRVSMELKHDQPDLARLIEKYR